MPTPVHDLEAEVLGLPPEDRARILERLIASFEPKSRAQKAWMDRKRAAEALLTASASTFSRLCW